MPVAAIAGIVTGGGATGPTGGRARYGRAVPRLLLSARLAFVVALLGATPAAASPYDDYRQDGQINPCDYSDGELRQGLDGLPPDVLQYSPGLADQLAAGREGCGGGAPGSTTDPREFETVPLIGAARGGGRGDGAPAKAKIPDPPAPRAAAKSRLAEITAPPVSATSRADVPGWVVALLVAAGIAAILFTLARTSGLGADRLIRPLRASFAEAAGRTADAAAQLFDSVRLGR